MSSLSVKNLRSCGTNLSYTETCSTKRQPLMHHERARTVKEISRGLIRHTAKM